MTWTYSENPAGSNLDAIRALVGDVDATDQLVSDEIINWSLTQHPSIYTAAAEVADHLAAKFAREVNRRAVDLQLGSSDKLDYYTSLARKLRRQAVVMEAVPVAGGIVRETNTALLQPDFYRGLHDH